MGAPRKTVARKSTLATSETDAWARSLAMAKKRMEPIRAAGTPPRGVVQRTADLTIPDPPRRAEPLPAPIPDIFPPSVHDAKTEVAELPFSGETSDMTRPDIKADWIEMRPRPQPKPTRPPALPRKTPPPAPIAATPPPRPVAIAPAPLRAPSPPSMPHRMEQPVAPVIDLAQARAERASSAAFHLAPGQGQSPAGSTPLPATAPSMGGGSMGVGVGPTMTAHAHALPLQAPPEPVVSAAPAFAPAPHAAPAAQANPYAVFERIGLGAPAPSPTTQKAQKWVVSTYRLLGFVILTVIVMVLVSYIVTSVFYMMSDSWVQPMVVSPTDEKVLTLKSQLAEQSNLRDKVALELQHTERFIADQQEFQAEFIKAVRADLAERKTTLKRLRRLADGYAGARTQVSRQNSAFARQSKRQLKQEYAAGLIDRNAMLQGSFQLAQITNSNMSLAERQTEFENRARELDSEAHALEAILSEQQADGALSYEVLKVKQEYDSSRLESAKALEARDALKASLARYDAIIESIMQSPYLRAADHNANVAFVPYSNLDGVAPGAPVYACALEFFACSKVGVVIEVLPGEVAGKHPMRDKSLRGQMVELELEDVDAVAKNVLFVGSKPLFL